MSTVLINYTGRRGSGCLIAYESAKGFIEAGSDVIAIVSSGAENLEQWKSLQLLKLVILDTYSNKKEFFVNTFKFLISGKRKINKELKKIDYDFIYCPMLCLWTGAINSRLKKCPVIVVNHDPVPHSDTSRFENFLNTKECKKASAVIVHSKKFVNYVKENLNENTFHFPLCRHDSYKSIKEKKSLYTFDESKQNFIFFGRISPYKGLDYLYEAYKEYEKQNGNCNLIIAGNGDFSEYRERFESLKSVALLNKWIEDDEVESLFECKNLICVLPYIDATQSGVVLVAMDYGIPVIATNTGGLSEQIENGVTGLLVPPQNSTALYEAMDKIANNKDLYKTIVQKQRKYIESLSWVHFMHQIECIALRNQN